MSKSFTLAELIQKQAEFEEDLKHKGLYRDDLVTAFNGTEFEQLDDDASGAGHALTMGYKKFLHDEAENREPNDQDDDYDYYED